MTPKIRGTVGGLGVYGEHSPAELKIDTLSTWRTKGASRYRQNHPPCTTGTVGIGNNRKHYTPFDLYESLTIDQFAVWVVVVGVAGTQQLTPSLHASDANNLPSGVAILGLDTACGALDLTTASAGSLFASATFGTPVTIPPGRYWLGMYQKLTGQTTTATLSYLAFHDPRITFAGTLSAQSYSSALYETGAASAAAAPGTLQTSTIYGYASWFRQTA